MDEHAPIVYDLTSYKEETKSWNDDPSAYLLRYYTKQYFLATNGKDLKQNPTTQTPQKIIDLQTGLEVLRGDQYVYQSPNKLCIIGLAPTHPLLAQPDRYKVLNIRFDAKIAGALPQPTATPANSKKQPPPPCHAETVVCKIEARDLWVTAKEGSVEAAGKEEVKDSELKVEAVQNSEVKAEEQEDKDRDITMAESTSAAASPAPSTTTNSTATSRSTTPAPQQEKRTESVDPTRVMFVVRGSISGHVIELNERLLRRGTSEITDPLVIQTMLEKASTHGFIAVVRPKVDKTEIALKDLCTMDDYNLLRQGKSLPSSTATATTTTITAAQQE
ncbi:hypothetical protein K457DRAFT_23242 [Linnemannia elongata AG-77]|uniref:Protein Abitram n=1 Tax=Linnemannia elongata AG-77 TaxID=1314771 RepID=A0A197JJZ8_9FUNG|nr:hypothetical protein K457DRAFT_23242 [Linnemannia elongata AG-77]